MEEYSSKIWDGENTDYWDNACVDSGPYATIERRENEGLGSLRGGEGVWYGVVVMKTSKGGVILEGDSSERQSGLQERMPTSNEEDLRQGGG